MIIKVGGLKAWIIIVSAVLIVLLVLILLFNILLLLLPLLVLFLIVSYLARILHKVKKGKTKDATTIDAQYKIKR